MMGALIRALTNNAVENIEEALGIPYNHVPNNTQYSGQNYFFLTIEQKIWLDYIQKSFESS